MKGCKISLFIAMSGLVILFFLEIAQGEEDFPWLPKGECQNLLGMLASCSNCDPITSLATMKKSQEEWRTYFTQKKSNRKNLTPDQQKMGALAGYSKRQSDALTYYLSLNMPVAKGKLPSDPKKVNCSVLPLDGRTYLLEKCSLCHPIGPILTQQRDMSGWRSAYAFPPHPELKLTKVELETLVNYLANNMPLPLEVIPKELQAELPGY